MSDALVAAVWRSAAPHFLKAGVLGALAAWARDDGTFLVPPTVAALTAHEFPSGRHDERTIRYQLRALERLKLLTAPPHVGGRGVKRQYAIDLAALARLSPIAVEVDAAARRATRKGETVAPFAGPRTGAPKGEIKGETDVRKGGNKGGNGDGSLYSVLKRKNVRTKREVPRLPPSHAEKGETVAPFSEVKCDPSSPAPTAAPPTVETQLGLGMLRALLTPAALSAADARKKARQIAAVLRDLATRTPRPTWVDVGDVSEGLRRELKRLRISYGQADLDDAIAWVNTNLRLTPSAPATARRHRGAS